MNFTTLDKIIWAANFIGFVALLIVLLWRRRWIGFSIFTCFVAFMTFTSIGMFLITHYSSARVYRFGYWFIYYGDVLFQLGLIFEIARNVLRPTGTWVRDARSSFVLAGIVGTAVAVGLCLAIKAPPGSTAGIWEIRGDLFTALLDCELFFAMLFASNRLGLEWRNHVMALAQGLTVWAFVSAVSDLASIFLGWTQQYRVVQLFPSFLYVAVLLYWIYAFWKPERARAPLSDEMKNYLVALHSRVQYDLQQVTRSRDQA
ncbi:hypothetical protein [Granulicella sp. S190]|uniref:hypothetical protein n=1 Tax=Granulicella sp. S190 TaxID=1747226 RepID=UPI00131CD89B|nr:hypothetical protein [Granulicella sp. S190]